MSYSDGLIMEPSRRNPFGTSEKSSKKVLYKIADPFFRFWFQVLAARRSLIIGASDSVRKEILKRFLPPLFSATWEDLARQAVPLLNKSLKNSGGPWQSAQRFWHGQGLEWDMVARSVDKKRLLVGEAKCHDREASAAFIHKAVASLMAKELPSFARADTETIVYLLLIPKLPRRKPVLPSNILLVDAKIVMYCLRD